MPTLPARVLAVAGRTPAARAIVEEGRSATYADLVSQAAAFAAELLRHGLAPGDRVAIVMPNRIESAVAVYGTWLAGGIAVPMNAQARTREFASWLVHCGARHVVYAADHADVSAAVASLASPTTRFAVAEGTAIVAPDASGAEILDFTRVAAGTDPASPALLLYTSGTTGAPKGVTLSHAGLLANASAVAAYLGLGSGDSILSVLPFYYAYGASVLHTHLISGGCVHLADNLLFPHMLLERIGDQRITGFSGVPSTFALLLARTRPQDYDLTSLRYLTQAGGAMSPSMAAHLRVAMPGPRLFVMYGQTEATARLTWMPPEILDRKPGSVGIPVDGVQIRIAREDGSDAGAGEDGEVCARGRNVMLGYWNDRAATAKVLRGGWLHTGDIGHLDDDGFLYLRGRRSDMIKAGAHRIFPGDIEEVIAEAPGVAEVAVVGADDDILGQVVKAYVVPGVPPPRNEDAIRAHCRARLAPYKIPRFVEFVDALPRTASGKVRRAALQEATNA